VIDMKKLNMLQRVYLILKLNDRSKRMIIFI
jgi:hypothetical protein